MLEIIEAGGWTMLPIIACSVVALAIVLERSWSLRRRRIMPDNLVSTIWQLHRTNQLTEQSIQVIRDGSPLGRMLAAGVVNRYHSREIMKDVIGDVGRHVVSGLERYLNTLGTIASVSPFLGLLGTVLGIIDVFGVISGSGPWVRRGRRFMERPPRAPLS